MRRNFLLASAVLLMFAICIGCGSAKRKEGIAELQRIHTAINDIKIVVATGVNQQEFSRRLTDTLLKVGDLQQSKIRIAEKFSDRDHPIVSETYEHFAQAVEAYKVSKDYFGEKYEYYTWVDTVRMDEYQSVKQRFPSLAELEVVERDQTNPKFVFYRRSDMLQALWKVAADEAERAKRLIDGLKSD